MERNDFPTCSIPWLYFSTLPNGDVHPCCVNDNYIYDNVNQDLPENIWNSEKIKKLRRHFMYSDTLPKCCNRCIYSEKFSNYFDSSWNVRHYYNDVFQKSIKTIYSNTLDDGTIPEDKIIFKGWNFRVSNQCNFKCRICSPEFSSSIGKENFDNNYVTKSFYHKKFLEDHINELELIEISGGESLLWEETYDMMDYILEHNKQDQIKLYFNTNMSIRGLGKKVILDYWKKWNPNKLEVIASIDEIGSRAECIRKGSRWDIIENNLKELSKENFKFNTNITVSAYNVFRIPEIIQKLTDIGYINKKYNYLNFMLSPVIGHQDLSLINLKSRTEIIKKITMFSNEYNKIYSINIKPKLNHIIQILDNHEISEKDRESRVKNFIMIEKQIDTIRNENLFTIIPELKTILK